jgi:TonB family protein
LIGLLVPIGMLTVIVEFIATGADVSALEALLRTGGSAPTVSQPEWLSEPIEMRYPQEALAQGLEGFAVLEVVIEATGEISSIRILESSHEIFAEAVLDATAGLQIDLEGLDADTFPYTKVIRFPFEMESE